MNAEQLTYGAKWSWREGALKDIWECSLCVILLSCTIKLWAEAVNTAVYLLYKTSLSQSANKFPFELWSGIKTQLRNVRVFGSEEYVRIPDQLRKKLYQKSDKLM